MDGGQQPLKAGKDREQRIYFMNFLYLRHVEINISKTKYIIELVSHVSFFNVDIRKFIITCVAYIVFPLVSHTGLPLPWLKGADPPPNNPVVVGEGAVRWVRESAPQAQCRWVALVVGEGRVPSSPPPICLE